VVYGHKISVMAVRMVMDGVLMMEVIEKIVTPSAHVGNFNKKPIKI